MTDKNMHPHEDMVVVMVDHDEDIEVHLSLSPE